MTHDFETSHDREIFRLRRGRWSRRETYAERDSTKKNFRGGNAFSRTDDFRKNRSKKRGSRRGTRVPEE